MSMVDASAAWAADVPPLTKLVLVRLAFGSGTDGHVGAVDAAALAAECSMAPPAVAGALAELQWRGLLMRSTRGGWRLFLSDLAEGE